MPPKRWSAAIRKPQGAEGAAAPMSPAVRDDMKTLLSWVFPGIGACVFMVSRCLLWRSWRTDQRRLYDARVQPRIAELLRQEYEDSRPPEVRQRFAAQRWHVQRLRGRAEADIAAEARGGRPHA